AHLSLLNARLDIISCCPVSKNLTATEFSLKAHKMTQTRPLRVARFELLPQE
ncbi:hypothetical protein LCGC14_2526240, partial [marine sediment metagenome]